MNNNQQDTSILTSAEETVPEVLGEANSAQAEEQNADNATIEHDKILSEILTKLKPINFQERSGFGDGQAIKASQKVVITVDEILAVAKSYNWSLCINNGTVYSYNGCYWRQLPKEELLHFLGKAAELIGMDKHEAKYYVVKDNLLKQFLSVAYLPRPKVKGEEILINLLNGTFSISPTNQNLKGFDSSQFLTYQLPFEFNNDARAPIFKKYLDKVLPDVDQQNVLSEFIAYVFVKQKTLKLEKSLVLYGCGANGKSVFFDIMIALLGSANVSNYSLQSLTNDTGYQRAQIGDKLLNYASEISPNMNTTLFKQLVSGEPIEARLPYKEPFMLEDYAKLLFNTNELPKDVEHNEAFFRRFIILHFNVTIPPEERDPELAKKIIDNELSGVFNWVLEGLQRLLKQRKFTESSAVAKMLEEYKLQSDSVGLFLRDFNYEKHIEKETSLKVMFNEYKTYCTESVYKPCSNRVFSERIRNKGFEVKRKKNGNVVDAFKNTSK